MKDIIDIDTSLSNDEISKLLRDYIYEKDGVELEEFKRGYMECRPRGHPAHYDTGTNNHMLEVRYSASILLTKDFSGGSFLFVDDDDVVLETITKDKHHNKALVYDVSHRHKVDPHSNGKRKVLLFFFK